MCSVPARPLLPDRLWSVYGLARNKSSVHPLVRAQLADLSGLLGKAI
jgi:hypothetical protein